MADSPNQQAATSKNWIEQIKADAERITTRRLQDDGVDFHREREAEINAMEGVAASTPVTQAAKINPSDPGTANFQTSISHVGPKNVHATGQLSPTDDSVTSAEQANKKGTNSTK